MNGFPSKYEIMGADNDESFIDALHEQIAYLFNFIEQLVSKPKGLTARRLLAQCQSIHDHLLWVGAFVEKKTNYYYHFFSFFIL